MSSHGKFTVAIVGGGIGGLAFAVALAKTGADVDVDIYESAAKFSEIGAGIGMWPRVWNTLVGLGLEEDLKRRGTNVGQDVKVLYFKADQAKLLDIGQALQPLQTYHRAEFLKILEKNMPSTYRTNFGKRLVSYEDSASEPVTLHFKDGSTATCDVLVGADGIKSAVRRTMFNDLAAEAQDENQAAAYRKHVEATWSGVVAYRSLVQAETFKANYPSHTSAGPSPICYMGKDAIVASYPISQGHTVNAAALVATPSARGTQYEGPWVSEADNTELISGFSQWCPEVYTLLKAMKNPSKWAVNEVRGLPTFVFGRVALLGDAAHAMTPHLASGAGQAIEDTLVLATLLAQPEAQKETLTTALRIYDEIRRPFVQNVQELSFKTGEMGWLGCPRTKPYSKEDSVAGRIPEETLKTVISQDMADAQRWTWTTDPQPDVARAVQKLKAAVNKA
ncbi:hypothetical protein BC629DRAFT_1601528 [Irpex lacteus]|nr:hypothetical protein BC629DRAFT_1601528 [Irpex lacteus]